MNTELTQYDAACRALAEAVRIDEVASIRDEAATASPSYSRKRISETDGEAA